MHKNCALALLLVAHTISSPSSLASANINTQAVQNAVVFIYSQIPPAADDDARYQLGTGFLVRIPKKADPNQTWIVLVTARHIVEPSWAYCARQNPSSIYMRINKEKYDPEKDTTGVEYVEVPLRSGKDAAYQTSRDDRVDAAVIPLVHSERLASLTIAISDFASVDELKSLGIGDPVISAGLIPGISGTHRNYPFFKFGYISSIPAEGTFTACDAGMPPLRFERAWFIAANLVRGNSGSPIFYLPPGGNGVSFGGRPALIGVQSSSLVEADLAYMTPVEDVFNIIENHFAALGADLYRGPKK